MPYLSDMRLFITTLLLSCTLLSAQENKDSLRNELNQLTQTVTALYQTKDYTHIDSLNLRRDVLINQLSSTGYEPEGLDLLIEMDYLIARLGRVSSPNNPIVVNLKRKKEELARELNQTKKEH